MGRHPSRNLHRRSLASDIQGNARAGPDQQSRGQRFGSYWNVTTLKAIQHVEALPDIYSSSFEHGGITLVDDEALDEPIPEEERIVMPMFIAMDRPKHTEERRVIAPAFHAR
jgi:cytochrome P450